jgi:flavin reductase (DIM6/NTAB) family NADH-FMN oxidoreductase RutF
MNDNRFLNAAAIQKALGFLPHPGLLLATSASGVSNVMTIGWATFGVLWSRPVCLVMVRYTRYTYKLIEEASAFTVNIPARDMERVMDFCGSHSGRDVDKIRELGLAASPAKMVPGIILDDCALTYECRMVGKHDTLPKMLAEDVITSHYTGGAKQANYHRLYVGEIVHLRKKRQWQKTSTI